MEWVCRDYGGGTTRVSPGYSTVPEPGGVAPSG